MRRAWSLAVVLALTGCGNLLGIEVLGYDGGYDGSVPLDATGADSVVTHDGPPGDHQADGADGPIDGASADVDATQPVDSASDVTTADGTSETGSETGATDSQGLCAAICHRVGRS